MALTAHQAQRLVQRVERAYAPILDASTRYVSIRARPHADDASAQLAAALMDKEVTGARGDVMTELVRLIGWASTQQLDLLKYVEARCRLPFDEQRSPAEVRTLLQCLREVAPLEGDDDDVPI